MAGYRLSEKADIDFANIYEYGLINFGEAQASAYALSLIDAFIMLEEYNFSGHARYDITDGLRCYVVRNHVIYYKIESKSIEIVRILHQSMNASAHF